MALLLGDIQTIFKNFGKLLYIKRLAGGYTNPSDQTEAQVGDAATYQQVAMAAVDQAVSGLAADYSIFTNVLTPFVASIGGLVNNLAQIPTLVQTTADTYLKKVVAVQLGLANTATNAAIGSALTSAMNNCKTTTNGSVTPALIAQSGSNGSNADGFAMYFYNIWGIVLPQDPSPNIPDGWICSAVV